MGYQPGQVESFENRALQADASTANPYASYIGQPVPSEMLNTSAATATLPECALIQETQEQKENRQFAWRHGKEYKQLVEATLLYLTPEKFATEASHKAIADAMTKAMNEGDVRPTSFIGDLCGALEDKGRGDRNGTEFSIFSEAGGEKLAMTLCRKQDRTIADDREFSPAGQTKLKFLYGPDVTDSNGSEVVKVNGVETIPASWNAPKPRGIR